MGSDEHERFTPGRIVQVAYAVDDVREGARRFHELTGAGPFFVRDHVPITRADHRGEEAVFDHSNACGQWGELMVEMVTHHELRPEQHEAAMRRRTPGFHHVAWFVDDLDVERERLERDGARCILSADSGQTRFAFFEPGEPIGHLFECYEPNDYLRRFYGAVRAASEGWDGVHPVRERDDLEV